ncbi:MAG: GAF domain-containing protein [Mycobacterium sp.]
MNSPVPYFSDALQSLLAREADRAVETHDEFIGRAIAARLVQTLAARKDPFLDDLLEQLAAAHLLPGFSGSPALHDPHRLQTLVSTGLLDASPDDGYHRLVSLAAEALAAPIAAIVLIDAHRGVFLSEVGLPEGSLSSRQMSLEHSISQYVVTSGVPLIIRDARVDPEFRDHPIVRGGFLVAYLGIPLTSVEGDTIGALCVGDQRRRNWAIGHIETLNNLARVVAERMFGEPIT